MHDLSTSTVGPDARQEACSVRDDMIRILSAASFWIPEYLCTSAWIEHAPFAFWLVDALRPRKIIELGTHHGYSYFSFCQAVQRLGVDSSAYAIDTWRGDEHAGFYDNAVYEAVQKHNQGRYSGFSTLIRSTFDEALPYFQDGSVDLLHLDGRHHYEDVKQDFLQWSPKLAPHAVVLFHDTNVRDRNFGVWRFFKELSAERPAFEFYHGHGLGVVAAGVVPEPLEPLFSALESSSGIRSLYAALGQALSARRSFIETTEALRTAEIEGAAAKAEAAKEAKAAMAADARVVKAAQEADAQMAEANEQLRQVREKAQEVGRNYAAVLVTLENCARERSAQAQEIAAARSALVQLQQETTSRANALKTKLAEIEGSTLWRATRPLFTVAARMPSPIRRRLRQMAKAGYWMMTPHKLSARIAFIRHRNGLPPTALLTDHSSDPAQTHHDMQQIVGASVTDPPLVSSMVREHHLQWAALPVFLDRRAEPTLTVVTDSLQACQLFGGVGTSLVLGAVMAREMSARLRIVTRDAAPDPAALGTMLHVHKIRFDGPVDFVHMPRRDDRPLAIGAADVILTTSWWSTRGVLGAVDPRQVVYLMQEDERMFYPRSDIGLLCSETISRLDLRTIVNSRLLFDHLADGTDRLPGLRERGFWFDPAFPAIPKSRKLGARKGKKNFLFYARPNHPRNLYWRGLEVIDMTIRTGVLSPSEWNIHFVGADLPDMRLAGGARPKVWGTLPWPRYVELLWEMDLGLSLMETPHPSYPPLDLAAAGAVAVTNTHGPKLSLANWSDNIICAPPSVAGLLDALRRGAVLAGDETRRAANVAADHIPRDWDAQLRPAMEWFRTEGS